MRNQRFLGALALVGVAGFSGLGCVAHAQATGFADADAPLVFTEAPTLVSVDSDVWIVRDYDYTVYYVEDFYWIYRGDKWHRSRSYDSGWVVVEAHVVPAVIVHRDHQKYVHYRGSVEAKTRPAPHEHLASSDAHPPGQDKDKDKDKASGPPDHAGGPHDGPPGHDDIPGVGNQRKAEEAGPANAPKDEKKKDDKKDDKKKKNDKKK